MATGTDRHRQWRGLEAAGFMALGAALWALCLACESTRVPDADTTTTLVAASGNNQAGMSGRPLGASLIVEARDGRGLLKPNVHVDWSVPAGNGTVNSQVVTDSTGRVSATWILGTSAGTQSVTATAKDSKASAQFDATVTIPPAVVLHYDGARWTTQLADTNGRMRLVSVWGVSASSVFAAGYCTGATALSFDGLVWSPLPTVPCASLADVQSVSGRSATDVFAVRRSNMPNSFPSDVRHFNGQSWSTSFQAPNVGPFGQLTAVWAAPGTDAWAVGDNGLIRHFDGSQWTTQGSTNTHALTAIWGSSASNVFAVGSSGTILQYESGAWSAKTSGSSANLNAVQGSSSSDVFAVGSSGTILHFDGAGWSTQTSGTSQDLYGLWVRTSSDVYAVGDAGTVLHYGGAQWTAVNVGVAMNVRGIWGSSPTDIFIVGSMPGA
ncbi:MAG TPA: hypothetical protein VFT29_07325 [Gemmatimonadaceae bacterium]|nr:hypothetical protein [Gemmatimonadaceae bacterium]